MARRLTYLGMTTFVAAALLAACGNSGDDDAGNNGDGDGDGDGGNDPEICPNGTCGDGDGDGDFIVNDASIIYANTPEGFISDIDDGSGNATFAEVGFPEETMAVIQGGADGSADPESVFFYPLADTMVPGNLTFLNFQWKVPDGDYDKVMFRVTAPDATFHAYLTAECTGTGFCSADMPKPEWQYLGLTYAGQTLDFEIVSTNGTDVNITQTLPIRFSPDPLIGALYYWASKTRNIKRVSFGSEAAIDFIIPGENVDYACVSCHSVSRDGSTIAFGVSPEHGENIAGIQVAPTADPASPYIAPTKGATPFTDAAVNNGNTEGPIDSLGHNVALNRDGSVMAVNATAPPSNWPSSLEIRRTGAADDVIATYTISDTNPFPFGLNKIGIHPEYSPNSDQLVVTLAEITPSTPASAWANTAGGIATLPVLADGSLGQAVPLAEPEAGAFLFYPTWSPDGQYVAFMASWDSNNNVGSLSNEHAVMYMVPTTGGPYTCPGAGCIELTRGTGYTATDAQSMTGTTASTWPKFAPFAQGTGNVYFITFTSRRNIGATPGSQTQLWMFGVDTSLLPADPSFSPFWLPYQDTQDGSLTPYWTEVEPCDIEGGTCNGCLPGKEYCLVNTDTNACQCEPLEIAR